jgi:hypothetical protein
MKRFCSIIFFSLLLFGCREEYISPVITPDLGYLVVEGVINSGTGNTTIKLSRTTQLTNGKRKIEKGASVMILNENNSAYPLTENLPGEYVANALNLDTTLKYRLRINTNNKEYISDYVKVNSNPPIDSLSWNRTADGVQVRVNTHDPQNNAKYFQWEYFETWEFHSEYAPNTKYGDNDPYFVDFFDHGHSFDSSRYKCWQFDTSKDIILGSTIKYAIDSISNALTVIEPKSWKLSVLYSINVLQYAFTKDGYDFLQKMKKNTEQLGSIFDAQPSDLQGNIHCTSNPDEIVVGYISCCPIREKRTFIRNSDLPGWNYTTNCFLKIQINDPDTIRIYNYPPTGNIPFILPVGVFERSSLPPPDGSIISFTEAERKCVDCTVLGTSKKPPFWP